MKIETPSFVQMSVEDTVKKVLEFQAGGCQDLELRNAVIEGNMGLINRVADKYSKKMDFDDAVNVASLGMIRCCESFDPKAARFSTYAEKCMKVKLNRYNENTGRTVRVPSHEQNLIREFKRVSNMLRSRFGREPYADEVGEILVKHAELAKIKKALANKDGMNPNEEERLTHRRCELLKELGREKGLNSQPNWTMKLAEQVASLIATKTGSIDSKDDDETVAPFRQLADSEGVAPDGQLSMEEASSALRSAFGELTQRQQDVIRMRFFEEMTLEDVAGQIKNDGKSLTRERIRQIEKEALAVLRQYLGKDTRRVLEDIVLHVSVAC